MKTILSFLFIVMATASVSQAQDSFRQTCRVRYEDYYRVQADCRNTHGGWIYNDFYKGNCSGGITNVDGYLTCDTYGGGNGYLPAGSYQASCSGCYVSYPTLYCQCRDMAARWVSTSIYLPACGGSPINNNNGNLTCN